MLFADLLVEENYQIFADLQKMIYKAYFYKALKIFKMWPVTEIHGNQPRFPFGMP